MKKWLIKGYRKIFSREWEKIIPNRTRYLVIDTSFLDTYQAWGMPDEAVFRVIEFRRLNEAKRYIKEHQFRKLRLYKKIPTLL